VVLAYVALTVGPWIAAHVVLVTLAIGGLAGLSRVPAERAPTVRFSMRPGRSSPSVPRRQDALPRAGTGFVPQPPNGLGQSCVADASLVAKRKPPVDKFPQGDARMVPASMNLYELLIEAACATEAVPPCVSRFRPPRSASGRTAGPTKRGSSGVIDAVIDRGAMASHEVERGAAREEAVQPSLYV
jgi:hypothetical protein